MGPPPPNLFLLSYANIQYSGYGNIYKHNLAHHCSLFTLFFCFSGASIPPILLFPTHLISVCVSFSGAAKLTVIQYTIALLSSCNFMAPSEVNLHLLKVRNIHTDRWCINLSVGSKGTAGELGTKHRQRWATRCWAFLAAKFHRNVANVTAPLGTVWVFWLGQSKQLLRTPLNTAKVLLHVLFSVTFALANTYIFFYKSSLYCDQALIMQKWKAHKQQTTHNRCLILLN